VRNPLQNEETAFRFLLGVIAYFAVIVVASWIWTWLGVAAVVVASAAAIRMLRGDGSPGTQEVGSPADVVDTRRILVVANETLLGPRLHEVILGLADGVAEDVLLVCPLEPTRPPSPAGATAEAEQRLRLALEGLGESGLRARGELFEGDPLAALEHALRTYTPDEIVVSTCAEGRSRLGDGAVDAIRARFDGPVTYVTEQGEA
jgi:GABA permease